MSAARKAADAARARGQHMRDRQTEQQTPPPPPPPAPAAQRSGRKVRQTVDLSDAQHKAFAAWRNETAVIMDKTRLTSQEALAGLVSLLLNDENVSRRARDEIARLAAERADSVDSGKY